MATSSRVTRKLRQGAIGIDPQHSCALLVHYVLEIVNVDESGRVLNVIETRSDSKVLQIDPSLLLSTEKRSKSSVSVATIASDVINACKFIHPTRAEEVEQILIQLRKKVGLMKENEAKEAALNAANMAAETKAKEKELVVKNSPIEQEERLPTAYMEDLDTYLELLYQVSTTSSSSSHHKSSKKSESDGLSQQIRGTGMILQLCRKVGNLEQLIQNITLMGALARVLQEEYKKSSELTFNLLRIFLSFSNFVEMHALLSEYRIGLFTIKAFNLFCLRKQCSRESYLTPVFR